MSYSKTFQDSAYWRSRRETGTAVGSSVQLFEGVRNWQGVRTGVHGGDWKRRIALRMQAGTPMYSDRYTSRRTLPDTGSYIGYDMRLPEPPHSNQTINKYWGNWYYLPDPGTISHLTVNAAEARNAALVKIHKRIKAREEAFNSAPFLAELRETLQMIVRPADALRNGITDYLKSVRKKKNVWLRGVPERKQSSIFRRAVAGSWLEFSFGWSPTISDVVSGAEALARFVDETNNGKFRDYVRLQASGRSVNSMDLGTSRQWPGAWQELAVEQSWSTQRTVKYVVGHLLDVSAYASGSASHFGALFGVNNWRNIVLGAYEVIPFSWLADYFWNVNDMLEVWATPTVGVQWVVETTRTSTARRWKFRHVGKNNVPPATNIEFHYYPGAANYFRTTVDRTCPPTLGFPSYQTESPWSSYAKIANMLSVWSNMHDGLFPTKRGR